MILEAIYSGDFYPSETVVSKSEKYRNALKACEKIMDWLAAKLSKEDYNFVEELRDQASIAQGEENECHFKVGFSAGMLVHQEKMLERRIPELTRKARTHRLCTRGGMLESFLICPAELTDDQVMELLKRSFRRQEVVQALAKMIHDLQEARNRQAGGSIPLRNAIPKARQVKTCRAWPGKPIACEWVRCSRYCAAGGGKELIFHEV